jgi:hypothetical protein
MPKPVKKKKSPRAGHELLLQMQINRSNAAAGGSGANIGASALMTVLVTLDGAPVSDLGVTAGTGTSAINLPTGWTLTDGINVRPGGCRVSVTQFANEGNGLYDVRIVPYLPNAACAWLSGEYVYAMQIAVTRHIAGRSVVLQGGTLAKLTIL